MTLTKGTACLLGKTVPATYSMLAWHYYGIFILNFAKKAFLFPSFKGSAIIAVQLTFIYKIRTEFKLAFIL